MDHESSTLLREVKETNGALPLTVPRHVQVGVAPHEAPVNPMLFVALATCTGNVEVEDEEFGFLGAVARADGANELGGGGPDPPDDAPGAPGAQLHQVADKLTGTEVPELDGAIVGRRYHEAVARLQARHRRLVLVRAWNQRQQRFDIASLVHETLANVDTYT